MLRVANGVSGLLVITLLIAGIEAAEAKGKSQAEIDHDKMCDQLEDSWIENMNYYRGDPKHRKQWKVTANDIFLVAESNKCSWAMRTAQVESSETQSDHHPDVAPPSEQHDTPDREGVGGVTDMGPGSGTGGPVVLR